MYLSQRLVWQRSFVKNVFCFALCSLKDYNFKYLPRDNRSYLVSTHGRMGGFPGGGRGRNLLVSCSGIKVALTGRGILLLLPDEEDRERGSSPPQSDLEPRSEESLSLGKAQGRLSQDRDGEGEWVGEPGTGLLQRWRLSMLRSLPGESRGVPGSRTGIRLNLGDDGESLRLSRAGGGEEETVTVLSIAPPAVSAWGCWFGSEERSGRPESLSGSLSFVRWAVRPLAGLGTGANSNLSPSSGALSDIPDGASSGIASLLSCTGDCGT